MRAFRQGYFCSQNQKRFLPLGTFGGYFSDSCIGEQAEMESQHGEDLLEFQRMPRSVWKRYFSYLRSQGHTAMRLFPRGDSGGSAWEGLDIGGRVNQPLLDTMLSYIRLAGTYGIRTQLCLFTQPECSFYCQPMTRRYWGIRLYSDKQIAAAPRFQRRFLENPEDVVSFPDYYLDPDVRACNRQFLEQLLPQLNSCPEIFSLELGNEYGWAGPHATPPNTFRWELTERYFEWAKDMLSLIRLLSPDLPVCISNPGVGILGHDNVQWGGELAPDFYSIHNYNDICGHLEGLDYAAISRMTLQYTQLACPAMYGEWQALDPERWGITPRQEQLLARDMAWLTLLSGAPGCIGWCGGTFGEFAKVQKVFRTLEGRDLTPETAPLQVGIGPELSWFASLAQKGRADCALSPSAWCPDRSATDGGHRFCVKMTSTPYRQLMELEPASLWAGVKYGLLDQSPGDQVLSLAQAAEQLPFMSCSFLRPPHGYQMKALQAKDKRTVLAYLRNWESQPFLDQEGNEQFALRNQSPIPVTLSFSMEKPYRLHLWDLDTGIEQDQGQIQRCELDLGVTSHDYLLALTR